MSQIEILEKIGEMSKEDEREACEKEADDYLKFVQKVVEKAKKIIG